MRYAILGSCNEKSNEDMFFSELSDIVEDETCRIGQNRKTINKVLKLIKDNPTSLDYKIRPLETDDINREDLIDIITSDDGNVRVYNVGNMALCSRNPSLPPDVSWIIQYRIMYIYRFEYGWWKGHFREYFTIFKGEEEILSTKAEIEPSY